MTTTVEEFLEGRWLIYNRKTKRLDFSTRRKDSKNFLAIGKVVDGICNKKPVSYWVKKIGKEWKNGSKGRRKSRIKSSG
jgi:hypothetical protein